MIAIEKDKSLKILTINIMKSVKPIVSLAIDLIDYRK